MFYLHIQIIRENQDKIYLENSDIVFWNCVSNENCIVSVFYHLFKITRVWILQCDYNNMSFFLPLKISNAKKF